MDHNEAVQQMATEKYLLGELPPELREAFEEHFFDCPECAMDLRTAAAFVEEAKVHLPELTGPLSEPSASRPAPVIEKKQSWFSWWRPAFAAPVFATLLLVIGYQNLVTLPALRSTASEPQLSPTVYLHSGTRSGTPSPIEVDPKHGIALVVDRPQQPGYPSFVFQLYDPQNKPVLTIAAPSNEGQTGQTGDGTLSLAIPGADLHDGAYTLAISGVAANGDRTEIERHRLDFHLRN
jgi:Putative zinc-finger